jgi:ubiquinone/menaquinone biosynthesis C-methylase UbiE
MPQFFLVLGMRFASDCRKNDKRHKLMQRSNGHNPTRKRYNRIAFFYDLMEAPLEYLRFATWRAMIRERINGGKALEVGVGTGKNLDYYPGGVEITAVDLSPRMLDRARRRVGMLGLNVRLMEMNAQSLAFPDQCFDTVFATFVFCSVPDPVEGLKELRRVCKPDGRLVVLEHVRPANKLVGILFDVLNPFVVRMMGANINRRTIDNIKAAGWQIRTEKKLSSDIVWLIEATP